MRNPVNVRLATNDDGPVMAALYTAAGGPVSVDWSEVYPHWLVAEIEGCTVGFVNVSPGKPFGRVEMLTLDPELGKSDRARVAKELGFAGLDVLKAFGTQVNIAVIPFKERSYKKILKRLKFWRIDGGNVMAKRLI